jgi:hypothetical protein
MTTPNSLLPTCHSLTGKEIIALENTTGTHRSVTVTVLSDFVGGVGGVGAPVITATYGSIYFAAAATTPNEAGVSIKAAGSTTTMLLEGFTTTDNRLTNAGPSKVYEVQFNGSVEKGGGGASEVWASLHKNDIAILGAESIRTVASASDHGSFSILAHVVLGTGDYVELWLETDTGDDLTIEAGVLSAKVIS